MNAVPRMVAIDHWCVEREGQPVTILLNGEPVWMAFAADAGLRGVVHYHRCDEDGRALMNERGDGTLTGEATGHVEIFRFPNRTLKDCEHAP